MNSNIQILIQSNPIKNPKIAEKLQEIYNNPVILPYPKKLKILKSFTKLDRDLIWILSNIDSSHDLLKHIKDEFSEEFRINIIFRSDDNSLKKNMDSLESHKDIASKGPEAYAIEIRPQEILFTASTTHGLFNSFQTFRQLLLHAIKINDKISTNSVEKTEKTKNLNIFELKEIEERIEYFSSFYLLCGEIIDWPDFLIRGVSDDVSRGQVPTVEEIKREMKLLSQFKINTYAMYIEDIIRTPSHPQIGLNRGAYHSDEIHEIVKYAKSRYITVFPIIETLGHMDNILTLPEYSNLGEFPGSHCLSIANGNIYPFLRGYISEICSYFPKTYLHIGCDETYDLGHGNSKELIKAVGIEQALYDHILKVYHIAKNNGIENVLLYHDLVLKYPSILKNLPSDVIIVYWNYSPTKRYRKIFRKLANLDHQIIISPSILNWYRPFPQYFEAFKNALHLNQDCNMFNGKSLSQISLNYTDISSASSHQNYSFILGQLVSTWGDFGHHSLRPNHLYGIILENILSWNPSKQEFKQLVSDLLILLFSPVNNECENRLKEIFLQTIELSTVCSGKKIFQNTYFYDLFFSHPFSNSSTKLKSKQLLEIQSSAEILYHSLDRIKDSITTNNYLIRFWLFSLKTMGLFAEHLILKKKIRIFSKLRNFNDKKSKSMKLYDEISLFQNQFSEFFRNYEHLWLECAKYPNFERHLSRYNQLFNAYDECQNNLQKILKKMYFPRFLKSKFIWSNRHSCDSQPRLFRKTFTVNNEITKAFLQVIVGNHAEIYCNNIFIGIAETRFSLSILPIKKSIRVFDISEFIRLGENSLVIECRNFLQSRGYANFLLQLKMKSGEIVEYISDKSWSVSIIEYEELIQNQEKGKIHQIKWKKVREIGKSPNFSGTLVHPNLVEGEKSIQRDYFRSQDNAFYFAGMFVNRFWANLIRLWALFH
ncbi:family 20 glycosylhydrolase [Candidatus Harpocratesius sp.]